MHHLGAPESAIPLRHNNTDRPKLAAGVRYIRQLALRNHRDSNDENLILKSLQSNDIASIPLRFLTLHKKGQLLVWNGLTSDLIGACSHGRNYVVQHCLRAEHYIFTSVESLEEDSVPQGGSYKVFQWDAHTLNLCNTVLMERKIETIALAGEDTLLIATESFIEMYAFKRNTCNLLHIFNTPENNGTVINAPRKIEVVDDLLFVAGSAVQLTVWSLKTKAKIASSFVDTAESSTCLQILSASAAGGKKPGSRRGNEALSSSHGINTSTAGEGSLPPIVALTGTTDGNIVIWSFTRASPSNPYPNGRPHRKSVPTLPSDPLSLLGSTGTELDRSLQNRRSSTLSVGPPTSQHGRSNSLSLTLSSTNGAPRKLIPVEKQNLHHTRVMAVLADSHIIISADDYTGVMVMHRRDRLLTTLSHVPTRAMMLDEDNKRILLGDDMGVLTVFSYGEYAARSHKIDTLFSCRPHNGPISGIYLQLGNESSWERVMTCSLEGSVATLDFSLDKSTVTVQKGRQEEYDFHNFVSVFSSTDKAAPLDEPVTISIAVLEPGSQTVKFFKPNFVPYSDFPSLSLKESCRGVEDSVKGIRWLDENTIVVMFLSWVKVFQCVQGKEEKFVWTDLGEWFFESSFYRNDLSPILLSVEVAPDHTILLLGRDDPRAMGRSAFPGSGYAVLLRVEDRHFLHCLYCRHIHSLPRRGRFLLSTPPLTTTPSKRKEVTSSQNSNSNNSTPDSPTSPLYYVGVEMEKGGVEVHVLSVGQRPKQAEITSDMPEPFLSKYCTDTFAVMKTEVDSSVPLRVAYLDGGNAYYADIGANLSGITSQISFLKGLPPRINSNQASGRPSLKSPAELRPASPTGPSFNDPGRIIGLCLPAFGPVQSIVLREKSNRADVILKDGSIGFYLTYDGDFAPVDPGPRRRPFYFPTPVSFSRSLSSSISHSGFKELPVVQNPVPPSPAAGVSGCSLSSSKEGRYVAIGYSDGLVQVFDICERRLICRWFTPHIGRDMRIMALANGVVVTSSSSTEVSYYMIPCRFVYDEENIVPV